MVAVDVKHRVYNAYSVQYHSIIHQEACLVHVAIDGPTAPITITGLSGHTDGVTEGRREVDTQCV